MKTNKFKLFGIIALVAIIGVSFAACSKKDGGSTGSDNRTASTQKSDPESDFEARPIDGGKSVEITKYIGDKWEVGIPSKIRDLPVTSIGRSAFWEKSLIRVTIPNSVTTIGGDAFADNQLTSVTIPNSVITLDGFSNNQLTNVTIPNSVTHIYSGAFTKNQLTSVTIPNSVTHIYWFAFLSNQLTSITIGANVTLVSDYGHDPFGDGFEAVYNNGGKAAGTYTRPNTDSTTWTKQ